MAVTLVLVDFVAVGGGTFLAPVADTQTPTVTAVLTDEVRRGNASTSTVQMPCPSE